MRRSVEPPASAASELFCAPSSFAVRLSLGSTRGAAIRLLAVEAASLSGRGCCGMAIGISETIVVMGPLPRAAQPGHPKPTASTELRLPKLAFPNPTFPSRFNVISPVVVPGWRRPLHSLKGLERVKGIEPSTRSLGSGVIRNEINACYEFLGLISGTKTGKVGTEIGAAPGDAGLPDP